jgi:hypothetical protein
MTVDDTWLQRAEDYLENKPTYITETYAEMLVGEAIAEIERLHSMISQLREALVEERARGNAYGMNAQDLTGDDFERWIINGANDFPETYIKTIRKEARRQLAAEYPGMGSWGEEDDDAK